MLKIFVVSHFIEASEKSFISALRSKFINKHFRLQLKIKIQYIEMKYNVLVTFFEFLHP